MAVDEASFTFVSASEHQGTCTSESRSVASGVAVEGTQRPEQTSAITHVGSDHAVGLDESPRVTCGGISLSADPVAA
eukprot:153014-Rhodomonas_salina.2